MPNKPGLDADASATTDGSSDPTVIAAASGQRRLHEARLDTEPKQTRRIIIANR